MIHEDILFTKMMNKALQYKDREHMNFFSVTIWKMPDLGGHFECILNRGEPIIGKTSAEPVNG